MNFWLFLIPVISAFIGWFTNWIAIKMLFHPREPRKVFGLVIQGIFPKRQAQFAEKLGKLVSDELLSFEDISAKLANPTNIEKLIPFIDAHIDHFLKVKLKESMPIVGMFIGEKTVAQMKDVFMEELTLLFPSLMDNYMQNLKIEMDLEKIVIGKVKNFSVEKLEEILQQIMSKEFRFVEIIGAVLGFLIGLLQVLLTLITQ